MNVEPSLEKNHSLPRVESRGFGAIAFGRGISRDRWGLKRSHDRDLFDLRIAGALRLVDLRRSLLDHSPNIVHFAGHGDDGVGLVLEDDQGASVEVGVAALASFFKLHAGNVLCVLFNSCHSAEVAEAVSKHIEFAIGMNGSIDDKSARDFAVAFYDALGAGKTVPSAFELAVNALELLGVPDAVLPKLFHSAAGSPLSGNTGVTGRDGFVVSLRAQDAGGSDVAITRLRYRSERAENFVRISYEMGYIQLFDKGGPIFPLRYIKPSMCAFEWEYPALDIQVLNRSDRMVFLTEAVFRVSRSETCKRPLLAIREDTQASFSGQLVLVNESWQPATNVKLNFDVLPGRKDTYSPSSDRRHTIQIPVIEDRCNVDLSEALAVEGVDVETLCNFDGEWNSENQFVAKQPNGETRLFTQDELNSYWDGLFGRFTEKFASLEGTLSLDGASPGSRATVDFVAHVYLEDKRRRGIPKPSSARYDAKLRYSSSPYEEVVHLSQEIGPQQSDRFTLHLAVPETGDFALEVDLKDVDGTVVYSCPVTLNCFVPHSRANSLARVWGAED